MSWAGEEAQRRCGVFDRNVRESGRVGVYKYRGRRDVGEDSLVGRFGAAFDAAN